MNTDILKKKKKMNTGIWIKKYFFKFFIRKKINFLTIFVFSIKVTSKFF